MTIGEVGVSVGWMWRREEHAWEGEGVWYYNKESIVGKLRVTREWRSREKKEFFYATLREGTAAAVEAVGGGGNQATQRARSCGHVHPHFT